MTFYPRQNLKHASIFIGAFFCFLCLLISACKEKPSTPDWSNPTPPKVEESSEATPLSKNLQSAQQLQPKAASEPEEVRFLAYNLKNYLTMSQFTNGETRYVSKPEEEIKNLIQIIQQSQPDILGVCEIGTRADLKKLQVRLKKSGLNLPHTHWVRGADPVRSLAILSHFPIVSTGKPQVETYQLQGHPFQISRGVLDATIQLTHKKVRFLGVHFKSKRPTENADQEMMRRNESILVRKHITAILTKTPSTLLLTYGDFNDSKRSKALYTLKGRVHSQNQLKTLDLSDSRGDKWTHHWKREDIYSRFDYALVNQNLSPWIDQNQSGILDPKNWESASDHRPLLIIIQ